MPVQQSARWAYSVGGPSSLAIYRGAHSMLKPEVDSLVPHVPFNRRTFIKAALGSGFAAAVLPVSAQTNHNESEGLEDGEIAGHSGDTLVPAYRAQPAGKTHLPVIIVVHEVFG